MATWLDMLMQLAPKATGRTLGTSDGSLRRTTSGKSLCENSGSRAVIAGDCEVNATFTISSEGRAVVTGRVVAYDEAAVWTFTGVSFAGLNCRLEGVLKGDYPAMIEAFDPVSATGVGNTVTFTVDLSGPAIASYISVTGLPVVVSVLDVATRKLLAAGEITIEASPTLTTTAI